MEGAFWKIQLIQIQIYPKTSIEAKYGAFYLRNKVSANGLVLLVQSEKILFEDPIQILNTICKGQNS